jgi:hypothetical protein
MWALSEKVKKQGLGGSGNLVGKGAGESFFITYIFK